VVHCPPIATALTATGVAANATRPNNIEAAIKNLCFIKLFTVLHLEGSEDDTAQHVICLPKKHNLYLFVKKLFNYHTEVARQILSLYYWPTP
jgi:hypothetical protein